MISGLYTAASGLLAQERKLQIVSNNLANVTSNGFKREMATFNLLSSSIGHFTGASTPADLVNQSINSATMVDLVSVDYSSGPIIETGNTLDLALNGSGKGFFVLQTDQGQLYTRDGAFQLDAQNQLTTTNGELVLGQKGPITLNSQDVTIDTKGQITSEGNAVDQLRIVDFEEPYQLIKMGDNRFIPMDPYLQPKEAADVEVRQGFLEKSNVEIVREMADLIQTMRAFETYQKIILSIDETSRLAIERVGELR